MRAAGHLVVLYSPLFNNSPSIRPTALQDPTKSLLKALLKVFYAGITVIGFLCRINRDWILSLEQGNTQGKNTQGSNEALIRPY